MTTTQGYDGDGNQTSMTSANGNTTISAYDHLGRQISTTLPAVMLYTGATTNPVETTGYDGDGNTVRTTDALGALTTSSYDPLGRQVATTNPVSGTMLMTYTATELAATQDMVGNVSRDAYDGAGRLILASDPATGTVHYGYDAVGNTTAITAGDSSGNVTQLETRGYDAWDHAITDTVSGPNSPALTTLTAYDLDGNVAQVEQPQGDTTYNSYDLADQLTKELIYPHPVGAPGANDAAYSAYGYDRAGNVAVSIDADGRSTATTLDGDNRTVQDTSVTGDGTTVITTTMGYDPDGNTLRQIQQTQGPTGPVQTHTITNSYNAADWQMSTTNDGLLTRYGYDTAGRQRSHTIVDGTTPVTRTLDAEGRTTAIAEGLGGSGPYTSTYGYNQNDLPISATLPGVVHAAWGYDPNSQLISVTAAGPAQTPATTTLSSSYAYGYNATGWLTSTTTLSGTDTITHDAQGRLTADCGPQVVAKGGCARWTYDANGNLLTAIDDSGVTDVYSYTTGQPNEQTAGGSSTSPITAAIALAYDAHGDTTRISNPVSLTPADPGYKKDAIAERFGYDAQARPLTVTRLVGNKDGTTTPLTATLAYNADGLRADYLLTPAPGEGSPVDARFAYRDGVLASATVTDITGALLYKNTFIYGPSGEPDELIRTDPKGTSRYWYTLDGLGSVVALTSITGTVVDRYAYDSWGEPTSDDRTNETVPQQLRYRGYYYDEALTYYWVTRRYYDPEAMRWLQPDPSEQDGIRTYAYVDDDPIDYSDPTGLHKYIIWAAAFIAPRSIRFPYASPRYGLHKDDASFHGDARGFWNGMGAPPPMGDHPIGQSRQSSPIWNYIEIDTNPQLSNPAYRSRELGGSLKIGRDAVESRHDRDTGHHDRTDQ